MTFLRARKKEQKSIRRQEIVDITAELYEKIGYDKVTFSKIAEHFSISRNSLYNYFGCKEDIFLLIILQDVEGLVIDAEKTFVSEIKDKNEFIRLWAELMMRHQRMMTLLGIVNTIILRDASDDAHELYRKKLWELFKRLAKTVQLALPYLTQETALRFLDYENTYAMAIYPASVEYKIAQKIKVFPATGYGISEFIPNYTKYLKIILNSLLDSYKK